MASPPGAAGARPAFCPRCGAALPMEGRFCGNCGHVLDAAPVPAAPVSAHPQAPAIPAAPQWGAQPAVPSMQPWGPPQGAPQQPVQPSFAQTTVSPPNAFAKTAPSNPPPANPFAKTTFTPPSNPPPSNIPQAAGGAGRAPMKTMIGSPMAPAAAPSAAQPAPVATAHRTMMGMQAAPAPPSAMGIAPPETAKPAAFNAHRTMMGVAMAPVPGAPGATGNAAVANAQSTMMGVVSPIAAPNAVPGAAAGPKRGESPPMIGGFAPGIPPGAQRVGSGAATQILTDAARDAAREAARDSRDSLDDYDPLGRKPKRRKAAESSGSRTGIWVAVGLLVAGGVGSAIWFGLHGRGGATTPPLSAQVETTEAGALAMTIAIPGQPSGTVARYGHQQQPLDGQGHARFVLDDLGSRVGAIDLPVDVTPPNGTASRRTARIVLAYRVDPDLHGLSGEQPSLQLMFHVVPGSQLRVDGQAIATDATGAGAAVESVAPIPIDGPPTRERTLRVEVRAPDGTQASGTYTLRVPRTALTLDRPPATNLVTASERIVVRGSAAGATRVVVNSSPAPLQNGTFETTVALPTPGHAPVEIVAYSANGAPASAHLDVERIAATDRAAVDRFLAANAATVADLAAGALTNGRHLRVTGRVLGPPRDHEGGQTFQLVVSDRACPGGRCLAWVDAEPGGRAIEADAAVDVVGLVSGRRTSVTASGERRTDPVIHAVVLR